MTMLLSAWQDALRRNMALGDRREARRAAAREQPGMMERATGAVGGALMKILNPDDPEMARLKLQLQHPTARDAAQRQFQAESEGREAKRRMEEMRTGHGYRMEEFGTFKPTPEQAQQYKMDWLKEQDQYKETPEQRRQRELDVTRERGRWHLRSDYQRTSPGGAGVVFNEADQALKSHAGAKRALADAANRASAESRSAMIKSQKDAIAAKYAPEIEALQQKVSDIEAAYPYLVGQAPIPPPRRVGTPQAQPPRQQRQAPAPGPAHGPAPLPLP